MILTGFNILSPKAKSGGCAPRLRLILCWPKRVSRKGPALRWACLARQGGNINTDNSNRSKVQVPLAGPEALESLSFCGELQRSSLLSSFCLVSHTEREAPL